ncbi:MAG: hypothetical protein Q9169_001874 [Polycauliona sp. 2 TL-2023]
MANPDLNPHGVSNMQQLQFEAHTNTIDLHDDDPQAFQVFVQWLYTGRFVNHAMLQLVTFYDDAYLHSNVLDDAYRLSSPGSELRQFVVDEFLSEISWGSSEGETHGTDVRRPGYWDIERLGLEDFNKDALTRMIETEGKFIDTCRIGDRYLLVLDWDTHGKQYQQD